MKTTLLWVAALILLFSGCSSEEVILRREDRLVGQWEIEKVSFRKDDELFYKDVTSEYSGDGMQFLADFSAGYEDNSLGEMFLGSWVLEFVENDAHCESETSLHFEANFDDYVNESAMSYAGYVNRLSQNKFHFTMEEEAGDFRYKFRKREDFLQSN